MGLTDDSLTLGRACPYTAVMLPASILEDLSPHARVITAILPFLWALVFRLILGNNRLTRILLSVSTTWFAMNVLMAPYSAGMREDLLSLRYIFR